MDDWAWFRWVVGGLIAFFGGMSTWTALKTLENEKKIAVLEAQKIDAIELAKTLTNLSNAITTLTNQMIENDRRRSEQFEEMKKKNAELTRLIHELREELLVPG